jgi:hypothetical protein
MRYNSVFMVFNVIMRLKVFFWYYPPCFGNWLHKSIIRVFWRRKNQLFRVVKSVLK